MVEVEGCCEIYSQDHGNEYVIVKLSSYYKHTSLKKQPCHLMKFFKFVELIFDF